MYPHPGRLLCMLDWSWVKKSEDFALWTSQTLKIAYTCTFYRLVSGSGDVKLTKDGNVLLHEMVSFTIEICDLAEFAFVEQESPPAWTQEAYRPPCSECSLCWSVGGGTPLRSRGWGERYPIPGPGGVPCPRSGGYPVPCPGGYPIPGGYLARVPPCKTWDGVPPPGQT